MSVWIWQSLQRFSLWKFLNFIILSLMRRTCSLVCQLKRYCFPNRNGVLILCWIGGSIFSKRRKGKYSSKLQLAICGGTNSAWIFHKLNTLVFKFNSRWSTGMPAACMDNWGKVRSLKHLVLTCPSPDMNHCAYMDQHRGHYTRTRVNNISSVLRMLASRIIVSWQNMITFFSI